MSRFRTLLLASAALVVGACSDTQSPTNPSTDPEPALTQENATKGVYGVWGDAKAAAAARKEVDAEDSPFLCNFGGSGPECLRVFHRGTLLQRVYHEGIAQGNGCSRSIIRVAGRVVGRSSFVCHVRGDVLFITWFFGDRYPFGTRIQVDFTGAGGASPTGKAITNFN